MLRIYRYGEGQFSMIRPCCWDGGIDLDGEHVADPAQADVFVLPQITSAVGTENIARLPYFKGNEARHFFFDLTDYPPRLPHWAPIYVCAGARRSMRVAHHNLFCSPWPVEDFVAVTFLPEGGFRYDASFVGWRTPLPLTQQMIDSVQASGLRTYLKPYPEFFGHMLPDDQETIRRRSEFISIQQSSKLLLGAESAHGVLRYRFFEAMSAARIPVHIGDDYLLPFESEIPWNEVAILISGSDVARTGGILRDFIDTHTDDEIITIGKRAREIYERYLRGADWQRIWTDLVTTHLAKL